MSSARSEEGGDGRDEDEDDVELAVAALDPAEPAETAHGKPRCGEQDAIKNGVVDVRLEGARGREKTVQRRGVRRGTQRAPKEGDDRVGEG